MYIVLHDFHSESVSEEATDPTSQKKDHKEENQHESVRAFEKAFGLNKLEQIIADTKLKRNLLMQDPLKHKYIFQSMDLETQKEAIEDFRTKHTVIT